MRRGCWAGVAVVIGSSLVGCGGGESARSSIGEIARETTVPFDSSLGTTEVVADVPTRDGIEGAFAALIDRRVQCGRSPKDCDVDRIAVPGTEVHRDLVDLMNERVANHVVASTTGSLRYRIESVSMVGAEAAAIRLCFTDDTVLVQPMPPVADELLPPIVVDDSLFSARTDWDLRWHEGEWRWADEHPINWAVGEDLCAA